MANREKQKAKLDRDQELEDNNPKSSIQESSSDDEAEANEDLSLKIVEKSLLMRASKLAHNHAVSGDNSFSVVYPSSDSPRELEKFVAGNKKEIKKKKKVIELCYIYIYIILLVFVCYQQNRGFFEMNTAKVEKTEAVESNPNVVQISDNIVLRKLLRGARYFDMPDSGWESCYNCGEGHMTVNCTSSVKRKKPCYVCGSLAHAAKQCPKGQDCYICKKGGHRARYCPEKYHGVSQNDKCLKCGYSGHDMFSCKNDYSSDDLKEIQCYICKSFGHLCCVNYVNTSPREVSCYRCGQPGHTGLTCGKLGGETNGVASPSLCYKCREGGHFARECTSSAKRAWKRNRELSPTPQRLHRENEDCSRFISAPHDLGKAQKRKKAQYIGDITTPQTTKHRGGWITEYPGDISDGKSKKYRWRSPGTGTPSKEHHKLSTLTAGDHISGPKSFKNRTSNHRFSVSRFHNSVSDEKRRNYNRW
ncbi:zf-CCHC domain-containing protein [Cephalotus follicularis]|uniref:Zf-CCHC domain-containing protein n=1 Tax=Cephalotus follicularis TaxID=3775 RepID=A0A1Q3CWS2_CEPFO|nr:zf-CCHC domain-containing protein [Cephalotus follicularis]